MTKREAIRECKRMWKEIVESGLGKYAFLKTRAGEKWMEKRYRLSCPLCQYTQGACSECPLYVQYNQGCDTCGHYDDPKGFYEYVKGLKE